MINFFIKHKKARGVITVFLTMIYLSVYMLIGVLVDGGRIRMAQTVVEDVQQVATENVMSQYNRGLYEYYGLFGVSDYEIEQIAQDVQSQIEESIGIKVPKSTVESFMSDVWTTGESIIKNNGIDVEKIKNDLKDSHNIFNPYGLKVNSAKATYIDLTETDAIRAQMRDEMRYTAPLVIGANFLDAINQFISYSDCIDAVKESAEILTEDDEKNIEEKQTKYNESINDFSKKIKEYVVHYYKPLQNSISNKMGKIKSKVSESLTVFTESTKNAFDAILSGIANIGSVFQRIWPFNETQNDAVKYSFDNDGNYNIVSDLHLGEEGGLDSIINAGLGNNILIDYCKEYDNADWPHGEDFLEEFEDEEGNTYYEYTGTSYVKHTSAARAMAELSLENFVSKIETLINQYSEPTIASLETSINRVQDCMNTIDEAEGKLLSAVKGKSEKAVECIDQPMSVYLKLWNNLANQKKELLNIKDILEKIKECLKKIEDDAKKVTNSVKAEQRHEGWNEPEDIESNMINQTESNREEFNRLMLSLTIETAEFKGLNIIQEYANADALQTSIFDMLRSLKDNKNNDSKGIIDEEAENSQLYGIIKKHEKGENILYHYVEEAKEVGSDKNYDTDLELNDKNVITKVKNLMNTASDIVGSITKGLADNVYDETYILTHCRDYVHTYRYRRLDNADNNPKIDTILNAKFVKNQHSTKYLSNDQFKEFEVNPAEIEYIIWGSKEDTNARDCITKMYVSIFTIRLALNYIAALTSKFTKLEAQAMSLAAGPFAGVVRFAAPLIYAIPQSIMETKGIMYDCIKVNVWNGGDDLHLWNAINTFAEDTAGKLKETSEKIKENAKTMIRNAVEHADVLITAEVVKGNGAPENIVSAATYLEGSVLLNNLKEDCVDLGNNTESEPKDKKIKAGYSDYLLIFLFVRGIGGLKASQISNLQDVIETNMRKAQSDDFRLKNTYSQIAVEIESNMKFIFMTHSLMKKTFKGTDKYKDFSFITRTSYSY